MKVPRLSVEFARWFERRVYAGNSKADGHQKAKSTYKLYVRHVERFLLFEQQRTNPEPCLDDVLLDFGAERLVKLPSPALYRDTLPLHGKKTLNQVGEANCRRTNFTH